MMMTKHDDDDEDDYENEGYDEESSEPDHGDAQSESELGPKADEVSDDESVDEDMLVETVGEDDRRGRLKRQRGRASRDCR